MSKGTIKYSQEFKSEFGNRWIGIDLVVNENDDWDEKFKESLDMVNGWAKVSPKVVYDLHPSLQKTFSSIQVEQPLPSLDYKAKEKLEKLIDDATTVQELLAYKDEVWKHGLIDYYADKLGILQNKHLTQ